VALETRVAVAEAELQPQSMQGVPDMYRATRRALQGFLMCLLLACFALCACSPPKYHGDDPYKILRLVSAVKKYKLAHGTLPVSLDEILGMETPERILSRASLVDNWRNRFYYVIELQLEGGFKVSSLGADGKLGGFGLDTDFGYDGAAYGTDRLAGPTISAHVVARHHDYSTAVRFWLSRQHPLPRANAVNQRSPRSSVQAHGLAVPRVSVDNPRISS
jgi:hypothetical protein